MVIQKHFLEIKTFEKPFEIVTNIPTSPSKKWIIYLHGMPGGPLNEIQEYLQFFEPMQLNSLTYNYPGVWDSPGTFSYEDLSLVSTSIFSFLDDFKAEKVYLYGDSFGGPVAFSIVANNLYSIEKVILKSPVTDFTPLMPFLPSTLHYLNQTGIIKDSPNKILADITKINPIDLFSRTKHVKFWGVIGKDDEVLPGKKMVEATLGQNHINLELWDEFPHNMILPSFKEFLMQVKSFLD